MPDTPTLAEVVALIAKADDWLNKKGDPIACHCELVNLLACIPADAELFDVERLARALHCIHPGPAPWPGPMTSDEMAAAILAAAKETP